MKLVRSILLVGILLSLFTGSAFGQKNEFMNAVKKDIRSFDGSYYVDLSKKKYSLEDISVFAKNNGYKVVSLQYGTVTDYNDPNKIQISSVNMLPYGASPDVEKGHANPSDEPYKTITKLVTNALGKKPGSMGTYDLDLTGKGFKTTHLENFREVARAQHCFFPCYASEVDWASGRIGSAPQLLTHVHLVPESMLPNWVMKQTFSDISKKSEEFKTGKVRLDPEKNEWVDGVLWSGDVSGDKLTGSGKGIKIVSKDWKSFTMEGLIIDGSFKDGLPVGEVKYRYGTISMEGKISLYGKYISWDNERKDAGYSLVLTPQDDPEVRLLEKAKTTADGWGKIGKHDIQYGYVNNDFSLIFWMPLNSDNFEFVQQFKNGKAIIKEKKIVDHGFWRSFINADIRWICYTVTTKGEFSIEADEQKRILKGYDALMDYWNKMLQPYNGGDDVQEPAAWDMLKGWDTYIGLFNKQLVPDGPLGVVRANRSNLDKYEVLRQLIRLNELAYVTSDDLSYSFIYENRNWAKNRRAEGEQIMANLRGKSNNGYAVDVSYSNPESALSAKNGNGQYQFNPPYMDSVFANYSKRLERLEKIYSREIQRAIRWHDQLREDAKRREEERRQELCNSCKVDGEKSTVPTGFQEKWEFLIIFGEPAQSKESGTIVLENGKETKWKYIFKDDETYILAWGDFFGEKSFDSYDEMIEKILSECRKEFCN